MNIQKMLGKSVSVYNEIADSFNSANNPIASPGLVIQNNDGTQLLSIQVLDDGRLDVTVADESSYTDAAIEFLDAVRDRLIVLNGRFNQ